MILNERLTKKALIQKAYDLIETEKSHSMPKTEVTKLAIACVVAGLIVGSYW